MQISPELTGLSSSEVQSRVDQGQTNSQEFGKSRSILTILRANLLTLFNAVVGGSFLVLLILGYWKDALFGIAVITNILIGVIQEYRSKLILDRLTILSKSPVQVRRGGESSLIPIEDVVIEDLIELKAGDQLSADVVVLATNGLELDESPLTGESEPVAKSIDDELLSGSIVTSGSALVKVIRVGAQTYSSKLVSEARAFSKVSSEIRRALEKVIVWISWALGPVILIVVYGQLQATSIWEEAVVSSVASVISMVPQGLVLIVSIAFAIAATRLAKRKVLLQELAAVEGLARVDVVCIDKTGTLTGSGMVLDQVIELDSKYPDWKSALGEFAHLPTANATAKALQDQFPSLGLDVKAVVEFSSATKFSSIELSGRRWLLGAPEVITKDEQVLSQVSELAKLGLRTLLLAVDDSEVKPLVILTFKEELRAEAKDTLEYLRSEGVQVKVLSGDHPETVAGVARAVGLDFDGEGIDARELSTDIETLAKALEEHSVFGRVTPDQKKLLVKALQQQGHVVAMIGDGVNDALALKESDLGIAMGSGSPATRAVANLVLLDNRFASLPEIVSEGRRVIANVERLSRLFLTKTTWAMILAVVYGLTFWEFPFLPRQLSAIDGFTIGIPAFLLAFLPNSQRYQPGFLKRALLLCVPAGVITAIAVISLSAMVRIDPSWTQAQAQTATAILLSITGLWVLSSIDRPMTRIKALILVSMVVLAIGMFTIPLTTEFFGFSYLSLEQLIMVAGIGLLASVLIGLASFIIKARSKPQ
jgi:cation-transporting P-type ATPase E